MLGSVASAHIAWNASDKIVQALAKIQTRYLLNTSEKHYCCCILCGPDEERILDVVPREDGARDSG